MIVYQGLLNLRGSDIQYNPVFFSWVVVKANGEVHFFVDPSKITNAVRQHLHLESDTEMREPNSDSNNNIVAILHAYDEIDTFLRAEVSSVISAILSRIIYIVFVFFFF